MGIAAPYIVGDLLTTLKYLLIMNNYILINRTFCEVTPESAEQGDFSEHGFIEEGQEVSFSELVSLMREHNDPSNSPTDGDINTWFSTYPFTSDYQTGTERTESIHFSKDNTDNAAKYWVLARKIAIKKTCPVS